MNHIIYAQRFGWCDDSIPVGYMIWLYWARWLYASG